ncbi:hypothetical protein CFIMG_008504RA00001 [Ceratocystis fimbriata CBS 114723]|uniref:DUF7053 domain-containing protein n=1 Tax=Ceratocystis fimbriata CBS 114723 TaxID=1035309 RepID=A0A2C5X3Z4_9PEZI|nr:hypothetical protein CFIMG_008504RA00001 [Ceratocystis fimbriata CBS 114723]
MSLHRRHSHRDDLGRDFLRDTSLYPSTPGIHRSRSTASRVPPSARFLSATPAATSSTTAPAFLPLSRTTSTVAPGSISASATEPSSITAIDVPLPLGSSPRRQKHYVRIRVPLPTGLPPSVVVAALHTYTPVVRNEPQVTSYELLSDVPRTAAVDPFFAPVPSSEPLLAAMAAGATSASTLSSAPRSPTLSSGADGIEYDPAAFGAPITYRMHKLVPLVPTKWGRTVSYPVTLQIVPGGLRSRADAPAGIVVWSEYRVVRATIKNEQGRTVLATDKFGHDMYELVKVVTAEANRLMVGVVGKSMEQAHRDLCRKIIEEVMEKRKMESVYEKYM